MILANATLVAGERHAKYTAGTSLPALLFAGVQTTEDLEAVATRELAALGWAAMSIEGYKDVTNYDQFQDKDTPESGAFRDAIETGFGIVIYP